MAALRGPQLGQPPAITAAYAVTARSLIAVITVLNEQVKALQGQVEADFGRHPDANAPLAQAFAALSASPGARGPYSAERARGTSTTLPPASSQTGSSASCTDASRPAPPTTRQPPGLTTKTRSPLDISAPGMFVTLGAVIVWTVGHGTRPAEELVSVVREVGVCTLVDVRRFPGSRHNPQFNEPALTAVLEEGGIAYRHAIELGGRLAGEPGEDGFGCLRVAAFRSYAARMGTERWQAALAAALAEPAPCFMCSETLWWRCHRRLIASSCMPAGSTSNICSRPASGRSTSPCSKPRRGTVGCTSAAPP